MKLESPQVGTALVGVVNMLATLASSQLLRCKVVNYLILVVFGRKRLLWTLSFAMAVVLAIVGITFFFTRDGSGLSDD